MSTRIAIPLRRPPVAIAVTLLALTAGGTLRAGAQTGTGSGPVDAPTTTAAPTTAAFSIETMTYVIGLSLEIKTRPTDGRNTKFRRILRRSVR